MSASRLTFEVVGDTRDLLGESPVWDSDAGEVWWIDARGQAIRSHRPRDNRSRSWDLHARIGSVALSAADRVVCSMLDGFFEMRLDNGALSPLCIPEAGNTAVRFGEGRMDRQGRYLSATVAPEGPALGKLYVLDRDGSSRSLESGLRIPNALCFSPSGERMYLTDSTGREIWCYDYDTQGAGLGSRRPFASTAQFDSEADGAAIDAEEHLWVALVRCGKVARFRPDGALDRVIDTPVPHPSSLCFGGDGLDVLYITTIADSGRTLRSGHPLSGALFALHGLGVTGVREQRYLGPRTAHPANHRSPERV